MKTGKKIVSTALLLTMLMPVVPLGLAVEVKAPQTVTPQDRLNGKWWGPRHEEKVAQAKAGNVDLVMIGDSITHNWEKRRNYAETIGSYRTLNLGFGGDRTENVLWRIQNGEIDGITPKLVTIMIGTNNTKDDTPEDIAAGIQAIVAELRQRLPKTKIVVLSVFPRSHPRFPGDYDVVKNVNKLLPALADNKQVFHVDINRRFLDENGELRANLYNRDLLHLSDKGYDTWFKALQPIIEGDLSASPPPAVVSTSETPVIRIWPEGTAGVDPSIPEEVIPRKTEVVKNIHNPNLKVFRPEEPNGAAVVICPGGGYGVVASGHEGNEVAERLNEVGVTGFVLKYRLPSTTGVDFKHPVPLSDALRAIQIVRYRASEFDIDPGRIGIMGFSAGGHLAASAGTLYSNYNVGTDDISQVSSRPDFMGLGYPVISTQQEFAHGCVRSPLKPGFSPEQLNEMSCERNVDAQTPPTFLFHAKDDKGVLPENSIVMHEALKKQGIPTELKLYEKGGHGFGLGRKGTDSAQWSGDFIHWLRDRQIIPAPPAS